MTAAVARNSKVELLKVTQTTGASQTAAHSRILGGECVYIHRHVTAVVHAPSCRPVQDLCHQVLLTKPSALDQNIPNRRTAFWSVSRHHCVSSTIT